MTDRELLELAAKAAGLPDAVWDDFYRCIAYTAENGIKDCPRNPLSNDGTALRLAVKLGIVIYPLAHTSIGHSERTGKTNLARFGWLKSEKWYYLVIEHTDDYYKATRLAIVSAAAKIGKSA